VRQMVFRLEMIFGVTYRRPIWILVRHCYTPIRDFKLVTQGAGKTLQPPQPSYIYHTTPGAGISRNPDVSRHSPSRTSVNSCPDLN